VLAGHAAVQRRPKAAPTTAVFGGHFTDMLRYSVVLRGTFHVDVGLQKEEFGLLL
jgi:hypothetical protein